jgi:hypothetical protein
MLRRTRWGSWIAAGALALAAPAAFAAGSAPVEIARWPHGGYVTSIAWDATSGRLYAADVTRAQIWKFTPSGGLDGSIDLPAVGIEVAVDPAGAVYVTVGTRIEKYDATGAHVHGWAPSGFVDRLNGLSVASGHVITFVGGPDDLVRFTLDGVRVDDWPVGLASDVAATASRVYFIEDDVTDAPIQSNATGPAWGSYQTFHLPEEELTPVALATNASGRLFVAELAGQMFEYDSGVLVSRWNTAVPPQAVAATDDGRVFVVEGHDIAVYSFAATPAASISLGALKARYRGTARP